MATSEALVARIDRDLLSDLMIEREPIRDWANGVLQEALTQKGIGNGALQRLEGLIALRGFEALSQVTRTFLPTH